MKHDSTTQKYYTGEEGEAYARSKFPDPGSLHFELHARPFRPWLRSTDSLLDFGCGNGGLLNVLRGDVHAVTGLEVNPYAAGIASGLGLSVVGRLEDLPEESCFDVIVSNHVLEHIRDVNTALERLKPFLRPEGRLLLKLPIDDWRTSHQQGWSREDPDHHLHTWTPRLMGNVMFDCGYEVDDIRVLTTASHPRLFRFHRWGLGHLAGWALAVVKHRRQLFVRARRSG